jgi:hypothetical protein
VCHRLGEKCHVSHHTLSLRPAIFFFFHGLPTPTLGLHLSISPFVLRGGRWFEEGGECVDHVLRGCYNNGTCVAPDTCQCASGWTGFDCSIPVCTQVRWARRSERRGEAERGLGDVGLRVREGAIRGRAFGERAFQSCTGLSSSHSASKRPTHPVGLCGAGVSPQRQLHAAQHVHLRGRVGGARLLPAPLCSGTCTHHTLPSIRPNHAAHEHTPAPCPLDLTSICIILYLPLFAALYAPPLPLRSATTAGPASPRTRASASSGRAPSRTGGCTAGGPCSESPTARPSTPGGPATTVLLLSVCRREGSSSMSAMAVGLRGIVGRGRERKGTK